MNQGRVEVGRVEAGRNRAGGEQKPWQKKRKASPGDGQRPSVDLPELDSGGNQTQLPKVDLHFQPDGGVRNTEKLGT